MSQPFDNLDWDVRRIEELEAKIKRLKAAHEEMLLKHAKEIGIALEALREALGEIERLKKLL